MLRIDTLIVGSYEVNCYILYRKDASQTVIIDPGNEADRIIDHIELAKLEPTALMLTHGHSDHIGAVNEILEKYNIPLYAGTDETALLGDPNQNLSAFIGQPVIIKEPDHKLNDEDVFNSADLTFKVLSTPGHSPGGVCYLIEESNALFCGDTLFYGSVGRTDFPGCSTDQLIDSINNKLMTLPDSIRCYPGHGPDTTIGAERVNNPFLKGDYFV